MRKIILILAATFAAGLLFVNIYTSVVDAVNWGGDIPNSLEAARQYFKVSNPGTFFRVVSPMSQIIALLALIFCWRSGKKVRLYCAVALVLSVSGDLLTFAYFYPHNHILFSSPLTTDVAALKAAWSEWTTMNWVRSGIVAIQIIFDYLALLAIAATNSDTAIKGTPADADSNKD